MDFSLSKIDIGSCCSSIRKPFFTAKAATPSTCENEGIDVCVCLRVNISYYIGMSEAMLVILWNITKEDQSYLMHHST